MVSRRSLIAIAVLSVVSVGFLWSTAIPLGVSGEWTWERIEIADQKQEAILGAIQASIAGVVYILFAWLGAKRIGFVRRTEVAGWLTGLAAVGLAWLIAVQEAPPSGWRLSKAPFVLYYPGASGYFHRARYEVNDTFEFLSTYEELMAEGDVLHLGTHPPGLFVMFRGLISVLERHPEVSGFLLETASDSTHEAFATIDENLKRQGQALSTSDQAVLWLATLITLFCSAGAVIPLYALLLQYHSREIAWKTIVFWPLLPALAIFVPKSDVLFVLPAAVLLLTWELATRRKSIALGALAGAVGWCGLFCSLAFLPVGLIALVASLIAAWPTESRSDELTQSPVISIATQLQRPVIGGLLSMTALTVGIWLMSELNLINVWIHNYRNHASFYDQFQRTTWKWLLANPIELSLAVGLPMFSLASLSSVCAVRNTRLLTHPIMLSTAVVWALLWLSGKNSGEAARLWIPLMTTLPAFVACGFDTRESGDRTQEYTRTWIILLVLQAIVCTATVMRVSGFHH